MIRMSSFRSNDIESNSERDLDNNAEEETKLNQVFKKRKLRLIKDYFTDYTKNSNLHGIKYIGDKNRTTVEKIFWILIITFSVTICMGFIRKGWMKWNESPAIVSFAENFIPVWQIPYPAVTVCSETKSMPGRFNFTKYYHLYSDTTYRNLTEEEIELFEDVSTMCDEHLAPTNGRNFSNGNETVGNIKTVSPTIEDVFRGCKWKDMPTEDCSDLFSPILTEEGLCYTFNTLANNELFRLEKLHSEYEYLKYRNSSRTMWTLEGGYPPSTPLDTYPRRGSGYGARTGLVMLLQFKKIDVDYLCRGPVQGFKILLHNPAELPRLSQQYFRLSLSQELVMVVKPKMMTTSDQLKSYDPEKRQCYFASERYLLYFKDYTQANCEIECLSNFTYARCGCVHFGMPYGSNMAICNAGSMKCVKTAQMELVTLQIQSGIEMEPDSDTLVESRSVAAHCRCLPACTSIEYEAETSQAHFDWKALYTAYNMPIENDTDLQYSRVMIYFKEAHFNIHRRFELYGQTDFLANCGGLLAFFMGFSILTLIEIIYFLTIRLCCFLRRQRTSNSTESEISYSKVG